MELYDDGFVCIDVVQLKDTPVIEVQARNILRSHDYIPHVYRIYHSWKKML